MSDVINLIFNARTTILAKILHFSHIKATFNFQSRKYVYDDPYADLYHQLETIVGTYDGSRDKRQSGMLRFIAGIEQVTLRNMIDYIIELTDINNDFSPRLQKRVKKNLDDAINFLLQAFNLEVTNRRIIPEDTQKYIKKLLEEISMLVELAENLTDKHQENIRSELFIAIQSLRLFLFSVLKDDDSCKKAEPYIRKILDMYRRNNFNLLDDIDYNQLFIWAQYSPDLASRIIESQGMYLSAEEIISILDCYQNYDDLSVTESTIPGKLIVEQIVKNLFPQSLALCSKFLFENQVIQQCESIPFLHEFLSLNFVASSNKENKAPEKLDESMPINPIIVLSV